MLSKTIGPVLAFHWLSVRIVSTYPSVYYTRNSMSNFGAARHGAL